MSTFYKVIIIIEKKYVSIKIKHKIVRPTRQKFESILIVLLSMLYILNSKRVLLLVVYFDQLLAAAPTQKLVETFSDIFC